MSLYEHVFIARQDISAAQVEALISDFTGILESQGGSVKGHEYWGLKTMAYRIKKNRKGHYVMMNIDAESAAVAEMERNQQLNEDVLRHLTLRVETFEEGPSVMMQGKRDGDRRGPRFDRRDDRDGRDRAGKNDDADRSAAKTVAVETKQKEGETPVEDDPKEQKPAAEDATKEQKPAAEDATKEQKPAAEDATKEEQS